jgi:RNA polymerase sigma-70 factor (ECF subfamily)
MSSDVACEDSELIQSAKGGDLSAFDVLVSRHQERVYMISHHMLRNHDDALDVAQDTFLRAWKGLSRFDGKAAFSSWIVKIATNASIDVIRRRQVRPQADLDTVELRAEAGSRTTPSDPAKPGVRLDLEEMRRRYDAALLQLTAEHRAVLVLKELEDMSYQEIADAVGCSTGTVMSRLFYARKKMQSELRDIYEEL